ncbi:helix-turn-helix domain-containing protein [Mycolicibacterium frederiksbergense]|nr:helix-turn-helix transcriptional regulator [Mycolicibacterium frederiksbergense]
MTNQVDKLTDDLEVVVVGDDDADIADSAQLVRTEPAKTEIDPPHVATEFFAQQFQDLVRTTKVRMLDTDRVKKLTPLGIQRLLKKQAPDLPVSQTQIYRYFHGEAPPRLDVVYELARLFEVAPTYFVEGSNEEMPTVAEAPSTRSAQQGKGKAAIDPPHAATEYFAKRFRALAASMNVRMLDTDRVRKLTPLRIQQLLKEQAPDLPVSQTQIYRYFHGEAPPRLDVVYELARLFGVPPTFFVPEEFLPE